MEHRIPISEVDFKSNTTGTYNKDFGKEKDQLREKGFPIMETKAFIARSITEKMLAKFHKTIPQNSLLLSMPVKSTSKVPNIIPRLYAEILSNKTGRQTMDLTDYMKVRQESTARGSHTSGSRSENHFNISFLSPKKQTALFDRLSEQPNVLIDDVLTTGETMVAMASYLKANVPNADIVHGHTLAAVDIRKPTVRDITRISEKLADNLPVEMDMAYIINTVKDALSNFTRKKLMRFELKANTPGGAKVQFKNLRKEVDKMQNSLMESLSGNLHRYPLDKQEIQLLKNKNVDLVPQSLLERAIMDFYPDAAISETKGGAVKIFKDNTMQEELSISGKINKDIGEAVRRAGEFIKSNHLNIDNNRNRGQSL